MLEVLHSDAMEDPALRANALWRLGRQLPLKCINNLAIALAKTKQLAGLIMVL